MSDALVTVTEAAADDAAAATAESDGSLLTGDSHAEENSDAEASADADGDAGASDDTSTDTDDGGQTSPESYADFEMPEDMPLDAAALEAATPLFKELGLNQEQAQKVVDLYATQIQAGEQGQVDAFNQLTDGWKEESRSDKEFGGDKFDESVGIAQKALEKFGTPELSKLLVEHGVGNHPEIIRLMVKVGKLTQEDVPGGGDPITTSKSHVDILYPK